MAISSGVEGEVGAQRAGDAPADDAPGEHVGDEGSYAKADQVAT
jgi:hypothetical protein